MKRREFIGAAAAVAISPLLPLRSARAERVERVRRLGVLLPFAAEDPEARRRVAALEQGLRELGLVDGRTLRIDYRWAPENSERLRSEVDALVAGAPDLILANSTPVLTALRTTTTALPIVFTQVTDPIGQRFVTNLARPGGNLTGFTNFEFSIGGKWLQTLKEIVPSLTRVATVYNPSTAPYAEALLQPIGAAARSFSVTAMAAPAEDAGALERAIETFARNPNGGLIVLPDVSTVQHRDLIIALAARHRLPAIYPYRYFAVSGGLVSYGTDITDVFRRAAGYIDRILKGEKPGDLPVQAPAKFETVVNLKTAKALGLDTSPMLLARADEVIE
jgi:putative ABC transport system substrate-binding protein